MKIAQVVHTFPPETGGIENHAYYLSVELAKQGHEVTVYTSRAKGAKGKEATNGIRIVRAWSLPFLNFSSVRISPTLIFHLLRSDAEVFHSHGYGSLHPLIASIAAFLKRKPFVFTFHGYPQMKGRAKTLQKIYKRLIAPIFLRIAKHMISVADATIDDFRDEVDIRKVTTIANGVEFDVFKCPPLQGQVISYIGRLDEYKGIDVLVSAFSRVKKQFPDAKLRIIGKDEGIRKDLERYAKELGVEAEFTEAKREEMPAYYSSSAVIVLPSRYEGLSLVLLESIASERPIFTTKVGASPRVLRRVLGGEGKTYLFDTEKELVEKISDVLSNPEKYRQIAAKGREGAMKEYSWTKAAEKTIEVYNKVLGR
ncbi:Trehalose synthase [Candidatus Gugararchaeum adminiculabundum]|nr:Trehalose synthase [Candidatus Gugararchaeum adminiculabundum]